MKRVVLACAAALSAVAVSAPAVHAAETSRDTCVTWGPTVGGVPQGACLPIWH